MGHLGGLAQPLRLARRRRVPDLGLQAAFPFARARRDAAGGAAARDLVRGGRCGRLGTEWLLDAVPRRARRARACRVRRPHSGGGAGRAVPVARARAQAAQLDSASVPGAVARHTRVALRPHGRVLAPGADARDGGRLRAAAQRLAARSADRAHRADVGSLRRLPGAALRSGLARAARGVHDAGRVRARGRAPAQPAHGALRMSLVLVGTSHRLSPVEVRERVAFDLAGAADLAQRMANGGEAVCLSTCNRTELYLVDPDLDAAEARAADALLGDEVELYRMTDEEAALHLFRVAAGLDSLVPGEGEILGQVRDAYEAGAHGPVLDRLFREARRVGKKVRTETAINESPASVSSAAGALAQQVFGDLTGCRVLLLGAGEVSELAARALAARGATISAVTSRTQANAEKLADAFGADAVPFDRLGAELERADVVVSSTSSPEPILSPDQVPDRGGRPLFVIDLAVPRDVDPGLAELEDCYLYDIDDLQAVVRESLSGRRREAERAEAIVEHAAERFRDWQASLQVVPAIATLRERAELIRSGELAKAESRREGLSESERRTVESLTTQIVNKLLHLPIVRLKQAAATEGPGYVEVAKDLFGLPDDEHADSRRKPR